MEENKEIISNENLETPTSINKKPISVEVEEASVEKKAATGEDAKKQIVNSLGSKSSKPAVKNSPMVKLSIFFMVLSIVFTVLFGAYFLAGVIRFVWSFILILIAILTLGLLLLNEEFKAMIGGQGFVDVMTKLYPYLYYLNIAGLGLGVFNIIVFSASKRCKGKVALIVTQSIFLLLGGIMLALTFIN